MAGFEPASPAYGKRSINHISVGRRQQLGNCGEQVLGTIGFLRSQPLLPLIPALVGSGTTPSLDGSCDTVTDGSPGDRLSRST